MHQTTPFPRNQFPYPAVPTKWSYKAIYRVGDQQVSLMKQPGAGRGRMDAILQSCYRFSHPSPPNHPISQPSLRRGLWKIQFKRPTPSSLEPLLSALVLQLASYLIHQRAPIKWGKTPAENTGYH